MNSESRAVLWPEQSQVGVQSLAGTDCLFSTAFIGWRRSLPFRAKRLRTKLDLHHLELRITGAVPSFPTHLHSMVITPTQEDRASCFAVHQDDSWTSISILSVQSAPAPTGLRRPIRQGSSVNTTARTPLPAEAGLRLSVKACRPTVAGEFGCSLASGHCPRPSSSGLHLRGVRFESRARHNGYPDRFSVKVTIFCDTAPWHQYIRSPKRRFIY
jgi:hypothetical protein